jgi:hypothetical protein
MCRMLTAGLGEFRVEDQQSMMNQRQGDYEMQFHHRKEDLMGVLVACGEDCEYWEAIMKI